MLLEHNKDVTAEFLSLMCSGVNFQTELAKAVCFMSETMNHSLCAQPPCITWTSQLYSWHKIMKNKDIFMFIH